MTPFHPLPATFFQRPDRIVSASKEARRRYREMGLIGEEEQAGPEILDRYADELRDDLARGLLSFRTARRLSQVVPWLSGNQAREGELLQALRSLLASKQVPLPARSAAVLTEFFPEERSYFHCRSTRNLPPVLAVEPPLASNLAAIVLCGQVALPDALHRLRLHVGSPVASEVVAHLTSPAASPWLWSHSREDLTRFLEANQSAEGAGRVANALLEPLLPGLRQPSQVKPKTEFGDLVGFLRGYLPGRVGGAAWEPVGEGVRTVFKWWKVQRDLDAAFLKWRAEPERSRYWKARVLVLDEVEHFKAVDTVAIRINQHWFIEVGKTSFATYVYTDEEWRKGERRRCSRARSQYAVRPPTDHPVIRLNHNHHPPWAQTFDRRIRELTGRRP